MENLVEAVDSNGKKISPVLPSDKKNYLIDIDGTVGDATLRSFMNWSDIKNNQKTKELLQHAQKLGQFRANHPAVGAGTHQMFSKNALRGVCRSP